MFSDFGFSELILIVAIAVLLIAPKELPNILRMIYKGYYKIISLKSTMEIKLEEETQQILGDDFLNQIHHQTYQIKNTIPTTLSTEKQKILQQLEITDSNIANPK